MLYDPVPLPDVFFAFEVVGFCYVLYTTPRSVTVYPPSEVTLPPTVAEVYETSVTDVVDTIGKLYTEVLH
jgi:hypothetical protein